MLCENGNGNMGIDKCDPSKSDWTGYDGECCTSDNLCGYQQGGCSNSNQCVGELVCGSTDCGSDFDTSSGQKCCHWPVCCESVTISSENTAVVNYFGTYIKESLDGNAQMIYKYQDPNLGPWVLHFNSIAQQWVVYLESSIQDPDCMAVCGPLHPYMYYDGNPFCVNDANEQNRWFSVDFTIPAYVQDPTAKANCTRCKNLFVKDVDDCALTSTPLSSRLTPQTCWDLCMVELAGSFAAIVWKEGECGCIMTYALGTCNIGTQEDYEYYESSPLFCTDVCRTKDDRNTTTNKPPNPNQPCVFPFRWRGKEYFKCTKKDHDRFWCGTTYDVTNIDVSQNHWAPHGWGHCNEMDSCPKQEEACNNSDGIFDFNFSDTGFYDGNATYEGKKSSIEDCAAVCRGDATCVGFHYFYQGINTKKCYSHHSDSFLSQTDDVDSRTYVRCPGNHCIHSVDVECENSGNGYDKNANGNLTACFNSQLSNGNLFVVWYKDMCYGSKTCNNPNPSPGTINYNVFCKDTVRTTSTTTITTTTTITIKTTTKPATTTAVVVNGGWSVWGPYGPCTVTCGGGHRSRHRTCSDPAPLNGGTPCKGPAVDMSNCNTQKCPCGTDRLPSNYKCGTTCTAWKRKGKCNKRWKQILPRNCRNKIPKKQLNHYVKEYCKKSCQNC